MCTVGVDELPSKKARTCEAQLETVWDRTNDQLKNMHTHKRKRFAGDHQFEKDTASEYGAIASKDGAIASKDGAITSKDGTLMKKIHELETSVEALKLLLEQQQAHAIAESKSSKHWASGYPPSYIA